MRHTQSHLIEESDPAKDEVQLLFAQGSALLSSSISWQNSIKQNPRVVSLQNNFDLISSFILKKHNKLHFREYCLGYEVPIRAVLQDMFT